MYGIIYNEKTNTLVLDKHDCGLLSNATVIFSSLLSIHKKASKHVNVVWPGKSVWNKSDRLNRNVHELYFKTVNKDLDLFAENTHFNAMIGDCTKFDFESLKPIRDTYFVLSDEVEKARKSFLEKYKIDTENTIAVLYRGTDKIKEVPQVHPKKYLDVIKSIKGFDNYKVLLQTDQHQVVDYFDKAIGDQIVRIKEMPLTKSNQVIHLLPAEDRRIGNYELGVNYLSAISILSSCKYVVFDTNNGGLWICILRGNMVNACQVYASVNILNRFGG